jgi:hypothetical protein
MPWICTFSLRIYNGPRLIILLKIRPIRVRSWKLGASGRVYVGFDSERRGGNAALPKRQWNSFLVNDNGRGAAEFH